MFNQKKRDTQFLLQALALAEQGRGICAPNPPVGALLVNEMGIVIATGYHKGCGKDHAEAEVLKKVSYQASHMTLYVTLEPCCHWGKTPPCTDAILKSGLDRVVYGFTDPNPLVIAGKGMALLKEGNVKCDKLVVPEVEAFYKSYKYWHQTKNAFVTAKIAMSLDGKIAGKKGERVQITGTELSEVTHHHRKITDAILTTAKTIIADDPQLNARTPEATIPKKLYVLDSSLSLPLTATVLNTAQSVTVFHSKKADKEAKKSLEKLKVNCVEIEERKPSALDLAEIIRLIGMDGVIDLWVEAGGKCFSALWQENLIQRALFYISSQWFGEGQSAFDNDFSLGDLTMAQTKWLQVGKDAILEIDKDIGYADHLGKDYQGMTLINV